MAFKEIPTNFRTYYKSMRDAIEPKHKEIVEKYEELYKQECCLYDEIKLIADTYKVNYKFDLKEYPEFVENTYIDGTFLRHAKGLFVSKKQSYKAVDVLYKLYRLARRQKDLYELRVKRDLYGDMLNLKLNEYKEVLERFYTEVHKTLILEGKGYVMEKSLGWICINRCKMSDKRKPILDYQATKRNKERILNEGGRLWDKDEARYAEMVGVEYKGEDYRVYRKDEFVYELALINCHCIRNEKFKLKPTFRQAYLKGRPDAKLLEECNYDKNKICELPIDIKKKLSLCIKVDDLLYLNFIRNEGQQTYHTPKAHRKGRQ